MTYAETLREVNSRIQTTAIKGKEYAEVNQRVLAFWELFPEGRISTRIVEDTGTRCTVQALVYRTPEEMEPAAMGHAFEDRKGSINSTSYLENCETSAVGRALGMLGIGSTQALASADEVQAAISAQERAAEAKSAPKDRQGAKRPAERPREAQSDILDPIRERVRAYADALGVTTKAAAEELARRFGVGDLREMDPSNVRACAAYMDGVIKGA